MLWLELMEVQLGTPKGDGEPGQMLIAVIAAKANRR
jgi:hypothetical protein